MSDIVLTPGQISALIYRRGYDVVRTHSRHHGDPEIIRFVIDEWQKWVRYDRSRNTWSDLAGCWNEFVDATRSVRYTPPTCRICQGRRNFFSTKCPQCWGRTPRVDLVMLDAKV